MQFKTQILLPALATLTAAQSGFPDCATKCIGPAVDAAGCDSTNLQLDCICPNMDTIISNAMACVTGACSAADQNGKTRFGGSK
jgi:hypothetical protein